MSAPAETAAPVVDDKPIDTPAAPAVAEAVAEEPKKEEATPVRPLTR